MDFTMATRGIGVTLLFLLANQWTGSIVGGDELSPAHKAILAELESRWWGWPREPAPIVPAPKSWKLLKEQWPISTQQAVVVLTGAEPSQQEAYIAEMLRREFFGKYQVPCRVVAGPEPGDTSNPVVCLSTPKTNNRLAELCRLARC